MRTRAMRQPVLVAVRALREPWVRQRVVAPALVASLLGVPTFGIGHLRVSFAAIDAAENGTRIRRPARWTGRSTGTRRGSGPHRRPDRVRGSPRGRPA